MKGWHRLPEFVLALAEAEPSSVLLHTARCSEENRRSLLFRRPERVLEARSGEEMAEVFAQVERSRAEGLHLAGYFAYESGAYFEPGVGALPQQPDGALPLVWLGCYAEPTIFDHGTGRFTSGDPGWTAAETDEAGCEAEDGSAMAAPRMAIDRQEYERAIAAILERIRAGETYQANFTSSVSFAVEDGAALRLYRRLMDAQPVAYGAYLNLGRDAGEHRVLSLSPELFFRWQGERLVTRPMKGTMARGLDGAEDEAQARRLRADAKNRAEHVMIVDLLRNDLGRIAQAGSVRVEDLFTVERYATLLQMTSTIAARIGPTVGVEAIFRALFPSGSITGAPKVQTMRILAGLERRPRGVYCGAIGYLAPRREAVFSVAIRTLELERGVARMGVGGGIVADSQADEEWRECLLKAGFLRESAREFALIETLLWRDGIALLERHMKRLEDSARYFDFAFDAEAVGDAIQAATRGCETGQRYRLRLLLDGDGRCGVEAHPAAAVPRNGRVAMAGERVCSTDRFLRHKTTHRAVYDRWRAQAVQAGVEDFLFENERGELTEGTISNVFVEREGWLLTPPLSAGVLPGVFRAQVLETHPRARERTLTVADLERADAIHLCNAVRGLYRVEMAGLSRETAPAR